MFSTFDFIFGKGGKKLIDCEWKSEKKESRQIKIKILHAYFNNVLYLSIEKKSWICD